MSLTKATYSMIQNSPLNLKDFGAVGDGSTNDTAAWTAFLAACVAQAMPGFIPSGTYMIDPFTLDTTHQGLVLYGATSNDGASSQGAGASTIKLRSASSAFVTINGARRICFDCLNVNGNGFADNVIYYTGVLDSAGTSWSNSTFSGATPNTGYTHRYAGTNGGENCNFYNCLLIAIYGGSGATKVKAHIYNENSNAFLGTYSMCVFASALDLVYYATGSASLYNCQFYGYTNAAITCENTVQAFTVTQPYNEQDPGVPFFRQVRTAGVTSDIPIIFVSPLLNSTNTSMELNCQQPVFVYGGRIPQGYININPDVSYGPVKNNIVDGVSFNAAFGISGTGALTRVTRRAVSIDGVTTPTNFLVTQISDANVYQTVQFSGTKLDNNSGATPNVASVREIRIQNSAPQNVTGFAGGVDGQEIVVIFSDGNTTLKQTASSLYLANSTDYTPTANSNVTFRCRGGGTYWQEIARTPA